MTVQIVVVTMSSIHERFLCKASPIDVDPHVDPQACPESWSRRYCGGWPPDARRSVACSKRYCGGWPPEDDIVHMTNMRMFH